MSISSSDSPFGGQLSLLKDLQRRVQLEELVARVSVSFVGLVSDDLDAAISRALADIGKGVGADRSYVFLYDLAAMTASNTHEWCAAGISAEKDNLQDVPLDFSPYLIERLQNEEVIDVPDVSELPPEASTLRDNLEAQKIQSLIAVALRDRAGQTMGFVGFDAVRQRRPWHSSDRHLLQLTGDLISAALGRHDLWQRLSTSEAKYRAMLDALPDTLVTFTEEGRVLSIQISRSDPYPGLAKELLVKTIPEFLGPTHTKVFKETIKRVRDGENPVVKEFTIQREERELSFEVGFTQYAPGEYMAMVRDITQRKHDETMLRSLALELSSVEEVQRKDLALLLHDGIGQDLSALHYHLQACMAEPEHDQSRFPEMISLLRETMRKTQDLTFDLSPPLLHTLGLGPALQALVRKFDRSYKAQFTLAVTREDRCDDHESAVFLFRIVKELLVNAAKHSEADKVEVLLACKVHETVLVVADNGRGLGLPVVDKEDPQWQGGFGLFSIRQRLEPLGGKMVVDSTGGARITITLPRSDTAHAGQTKGQL